jgi:hypothetical protein
MILLLEAQLTKLGEDLCAKLKKERFKWDSESPNMRAKCAGCNEKNHPSHQNPGNHNFTDEQQPINTN